VSELIAAGSSSDGDFELRQLAYIEQEPIMKVVETSPQASTSQSVEEWPNHQVTTKTERISEVVERPRNRPSTWRLAILAAVAFVGAAFAFAVGLKVHTGVASALAIAVLCGVVLTTRK
jgi:hypothetical protein